jgi:hypothetical protein
MKHSKNLWMAIKAITLNDFYRPYFYKDNNGDVIEKTELGKELTFDLLECHNVGDVSIPKPDR